MLLEADLVGIIWVRFVAVDGLCTIWVFERGFWLRFVIGGRRCSVHSHAAKLRCRRIATLCANWTTGVARYRRGCFETIQLRGSVHLGSLVVDLCLWAVRVAIRNGARRARAWLLLVQGIRIDKSAMAGLRLRAVVEDPDNLGITISGCSETLRIRQALRIDLPQSWTAGYSRQLRPQKALQANRRAS